MLIRVPRTFFLDHLWRELPTPKIVKMNNHHVWIERDDPAFGELLDDARFYADPDGPDLCPDVKLAAKALLKAIG